MIKSSMTPPLVDQATVDHYVAKARRERSRAFVQALKAIFTAPSTVQTPAARDLVRKAKAV